MIFMFRSVLMSIMTAMLLIGNVCFAAADTDTPKAEKNFLPTHKHTANCEKTSAEPVQIICILDRSGSMYSLEKDVIGGYNAFLKKQRQESGKAEVTTVLFDDQYEKVADAVDLQAVNDITAAEYFARGNTALMDAIGRTIRETLAKMENDGVCPAKRRVLVLIMTDGLENASKEYNKAAVKSLIEATTKEYAWTYEFIGANIDSAAEAKSIGIDASHSMNYDADSEGVQQSFARMGAAAKEVRSK